MLTFEVGQKVGCISAILQFCLVEHTVDKLVIAYRLLEPKVTPHLTLQMSRRDKLCFFKVVNMSLCSHTHSSTSSHCTSQKLTQHMSLTIYVTVNFLHYVMQGTSIIIFPKLTTNFTLLQTINYIIELILHAALL